MPETFTADRRRVPGRAVALPTLARAILLSLTALLVLGGLTAGPNVTARAEGTASTFVVTASLGLDGTLKVRQDITFAGPAPAQVKQTLEFKKDLLGDRRYVYELSGFQATAGAQPFVPTLQTEQDRYTVVTFPTNGQTTVSLEYSVVGAVVTSPEGTALEWPLLQGFDSAVSEFTATVAIPAPFSFIECNAGSPNSEVPCQYAAAGTDDAQQPTFRDGPRGPGEFVQVQIGFPPGALASNERIEEVWTLARAFSARPLPLALALGLLILGAAALFALHRRAGVDAGNGAEVTRAAEFVPVGAGQSEFRVVGEIRPGHVGTVADERVDPIDVTATLVDLAVRGHLRITEAGKKTWQFDRTRSADPVTEPERHLLDALFSTGPHIRTNDITAKIYQPMFPGTQLALDKRVARELGWFKRRPVITRSLVYATGAGLIIGGIALGLVMIVASGLGMAVSFEEFPPSIVEK